MALAHVVATHVRGWCLDNRLARVRLAAERDIALSKAALFEEEARILRARLEHVLPQRRPHYPPTARLAILALRAARGWPIAETARRFLLSEQTLANWMRRLDEHGEQALVRTPEPVRRFPDFVRHIVGALGRSFPALGKVRIAQMLARAGLHLSATTVARMRRAAQQPPPNGERGVRARRVAKRTVTARYAHHVWNVDITLLPLVTGFWVPWVPQALMQRWPFAFWLVAILDHHSRAVVGWRLFRSQPSARDVGCILDRARRNIG
jgi:transposase-like protein